MKLNEILQEQQSSIERRIVTGDQLHELFAKYKFVVYVNPELTLTQIAMLSDVPSSISKERAYKLASIVSNSDDVIKKIVEELMLLPGWYSLVTGKNYTISPGIEPIELPKDERANKGGIYIMSFVTWARSLLVDDDFKEDQ